MIQTMRNSEHPLGANSARETDLLFLTGINDSMDSEENERCKPIRYDSDVEGTEKYFETYF